MTDLDRAERIRRLQEQRTRPPTPTSTRRSHPASISRITTAGLGASLTLSLIGAMSLTDPTSANGLVSPPPNAVEAGSVVLVPIHRTLYMVSGAATQGNWAATPGTSTFASSGALAAGQSVVTTRGSR